MQGTSESYSDTLGHSIGDLVDAKVLPREIHHYKTQTNNTPGIFPDSIHMFEEKKQNMGVEFLVDFKD